ncbi:MAG: ABC transporter permease [Endomicrobium sp.]|jgi:macrolide transport system ATP-binding/permease protein|nr:ABC transporter permease [Endomicrobium sp.]
MNVIELKDIKKTYHLLGEVDVPVLRDIDLTIEQGEFVAIMGQSGSGKSTLLNILGLLDKPSEGLYKLAGIEISKYSNNELAALRSHYLGFVFQQFNLLPKLTILENITLPLVYSGSKNVQQHEDPSKLLEMLELSERITHRPSEISGGQQQRVAIARALINKPLIIFADEPTGNLDTKSTKEIIKILKNLNFSGVTIVMVTHEIELTTYATRIIKIQDGLILSDDKNESKNSNTSEHYFRQFKHKSFSLARIKDYCAQAFVSLIGNKMRSILSILGVMIGVASLIAMLAVGTGAKKSIEDQVSGLGSNLLMVSSCLSQKQGIFYDAGTRMRILEEDIRDLEANISEIEDDGIVGYITVRGQVVAKGNNYNTRIEGVSSNFSKTRGSYPVLGRFFTKDEDNLRMRVAVLGKTVVREIFGNENFNPVGEYIKINRINFQVIGVLPIKGSKGWRDEDDKVLIPLNTAMYRFAGSKELCYLDVQIKNTVDMNEVGEDIKTRLLFTHRLPSSERDAVRVINMAEVQAAMEAMGKAFSLLLGSIAFISLLVGGIGIMNIMFVSVSERTKEIGLRKAIGASNADILFQFIIESIFICCVGGLIGVTVGAGISFIINKFADWDTIITPFSIVLGFNFSVFIGLIFGVWPARKASLLNPIDALRHD